MRETEPNPIDAALAAFLESPVMIIVGSCDDGLIPQIARAAGAIVDQAKGSIDLIVSSWQWPQTIANVRHNGRLAVTFARPADYVSYQVKGRVAVIPASAAHRQCAQHYIEAMTETFAGLGLDRTVVAPWLVDLGPQGWRLAVDRRGVQTPGEKSSRLLEPSP